MGRLFFRRSVVTPVYRKAYLDKPDKAEHPKRVTLSRTHVILSHSSPQVPSVTDVTDVIDPTPPTIIFAVTEEGRACPRCGLTEAMLRTEGFLGCATCYETFADLVAQAAETLHGVTLAPPHSITVSVPAEPEAPTSAVQAPRKPLSWLSHRTKPQPKPTKKRSAG